MKSENGTRVILAILALLLGINIYLTLKDNVSLEVRVDKSIQDSKNFLSGIRIPGVDEEKLNKYINDKVEEEVEKHKPKDGKDALPVDYGIIYATLDSKIAGIPVLQGVPGINGKSCTVSQTEIGAVITCEDGTSALITNGTNGTDGKSPILRCNTEKNRLEMQYAGDTSWTIVRNEKGESPVKCVVSKE